MYRLGKSRLPHERWRKEEVETMAAAESVMFILYHHDDAVPVSDMVATLAQLTGVRVEQMSGSHVIVREDNWPIDVYLSEAPHVFDESRELAQRFATRPESARIATCDRRIEVSYEPDPQMRYFNTWLLVTEKLSQLVHGIVYDLKSASFPQDADA